MVPSGRALLKDHGLEELRWARAVYIPRLANRMVEILTVHVEDGMLFGVAGSPMFQKARQMINQKFNIKERAKRWWISLK